MHGLSRLVSSCIQVVVWLFTRDNFEKVEFRLFQISLLLVFVYHLWRFTKSYFK
jgi:hypothetical protein